MYRYSIAISILALAFAACSDGPKQRHVPSPVCLMDIDRSGVIDLNDIANFFKTLDSGEAPALWDFNDDGDVNDLDAVEILAHANQACV